MRAILLVGGNWRAEYEGRYPQAVRTDDYDQADRQKIRQEPK